MRQRDGARARTTPPLPSRARPVPSTLPSPENTPRTWRRARGCPTRPHIFLNRSSADAARALALHASPPLISQRGIEHPGDIAEAASLASISLPPATYPLYDALGEDIVDGGGLSKLQLEGVTYACQKHCERLADGARAGFMIGDGAGVGKDVKSAASSSTTTRAVGASTCGSRAAAIYIATPSVIFAISGVI